MFSRIFLWEPNNRPNTLMTTILPHTPNLPQKLNPGETQQPQELKLTNDQKYFEQLVSPNSINILITASDVVGWNLIL